MKACAFKILASCWNNSVLHSQCINLNTVGIFSVKLLQGEEALQLSECNEFGKIALLLYFLI